MNLFKKTLFSVFIFSFLAGFFLSAPESKAYACQRNNPTIKVDPLIKNGNPGEKVRYRVTVKNNNRGTNTECGRDFRLLAIFSDKVTGTLERWSKKSDTYFIEPARTIRGTELDRIYANILLAPGVEKTFILDVTSPPDVKRPSDNEFIVRARDTGKDGKAASANVTYRVSSDGDPDTPTPPPDSTTPPPPPDSTTPPPPPDPSKPCQVNPSFDIEPGTEITEGENRKTWRLRLRRNDRDANCTDTRTFKFSSEQPSGWENAIFRYQGNRITEIQIGKGNGKIIAVVFQNPPGAAAGNHNVKAIVTSNNERLQTIKDLVYTIQGSSPTPDPTPGSTILNLTLGLNGIGSAGGDSVTPTNPGGSNQNPLRTQRSMAVELEDASGNVVRSFDGTVTYNPTTGRFHLDNMNLGSLTQASYNVFVIIEGFLRTRWSGILTANQTRNIIIPNMVNGDINGDGVINLQDFNIFRSCSIYSQDDFLLCDEEFEFFENADMNDDGVVDSIDQTLWQREISVRRPS